MLEDLLANEPVTIKKGDQTVEVKSQGMTKGFVVEKVISNMTANKKTPDFVLCIGDGRSDEDMFERISSISKNLLITSSAEVFACTVEQKPSIAPYYVDDIDDVIMLLQCLANRRRGLF